MFGKRFRPKFQGYRATPNRAMPNKEYSAMNWIMKTFADAYSTALFTTSAAPHTRYPNDHGRRDCARERAAQPKRR